jgi:putative hydrolase of the HAD superfamily
MTVKAILFDLDDTLLWDERSVKEAFQATCREAVNRYPDLDAERLEVAVRREARALYESYGTFPFTQRIGINPFEALWARFTEGEHPEFRKLQAWAPEYRREAWTRGLRALGVNDGELGALLAEKFPAERRARPIVYEDTFPVLDSLKGTFKLLLLTNGAPDLQKEKLAGVPQLAPYFDHIVISGQFGEGKPAASIFRHALSLLDIDPGEGMMVGDKLTTDILGANGIGMPSVWINRHGIQSDGGIVPRFEIRRLTELYGIIQRLSGGTNR